MKAIDLTGCVYTYTYRRNLSPRRKRKEAEHNHFGDSKLKKKREGGKSKHPLVLPSLISGGGHPSL